MVFGSVKRGYHTGCKQTHGSGPVTPWLNARSLVLDDTVEQLAPRRFALRDRAQIRGGSGTVELSRGARDARSLEDASGDCVYIAHRQLRRADELSRL